MPLPLRTVDPLHVSRGTLPERFRVQNDLEAVANGTLANVIVQLSSLSHHAEEMFGDLIRVGSDIATRANNLQARIDRLAVKVVQMDGNQEELGSMQEALNTKPFQSSMSFDQQVVSRASMPIAMNKTYQVCDVPPPLDKLNGYRDDGKDGLKFYTDPSYFFDLWRQEMLKDTEKVIKKHQSMELHEPHRPKQDGGPRSKKKVRQPHNTREHLRRIVIEQGEHIMQGQEYNRPGIAVPELPDSVIYPPDQNSVMQRQSAARPGSIELDKPYPPGYSESPYGNGVDVNNRGDFRLNHLQHQNSAILNRTISQSQYDYDAYNNQVHNQSQHRYYSHITPPPAYSDVSTPSPNPYSNNSRFSGGIGAASTPRSGSAMNITPNNSMTNGYGFRPSQPPPAPPPNYAGTPPSSHSGTPTRTTRIMSSRDTLPPPPPPPTDVDQHQLNGIQNGNPNMPPPPPMHDEDNDEPLPPPPPPPDTGMSIIMNNSVENLAPSPEPVPPPPPPPPMMMADLNFNSSDKSNGLSNGGFSKPKEKRIIPPPEEDGRSELLKAIRDGINLRKVETKKEPSTKEDKAGGTYCDVASILARRVAVEMSDSDSGSDSEYDSDQWDEASA